VIPSPNVGTSDNDLSTVAAVSSNDLWALGTYYGNVTQTLTEHFISPQCSTPTTTPTPVRDAFLDIVPEGNAPSRGETVNIGDRFAFELWVNTGTDNTATAQQSYLTFTNDLLQNARVDQITTTCVLTGTISPDTSTFDTVL